LSGRRIVSAVIAASLLLFFVHEFRGGRFTADRLKRIHELEAREAQLYDQLAQKDAQRESQRQIYIDRIRKGEAQVLEHALEIMRLRGQAEASAMMLIAPPTSRD
jgi:hypothetical protein